MLVGDGHHRWSLRSPVTGGVKGFEVLPRR